MITKAQVYDSTLDQVAHDANRVFARLFANSKDAKVQLAGLDEIRQLLDSMALGTAEHGMAVMRIRNARRFIESNEFGAAKFETRMLMGGIRHLLHDIAAKPVRVTNRTPEPVAVSG